MDSNKYLIIILGSAKGIDDTLNNIADSEYGVNYVDGNGIFIATFFTHFNIRELTDLLMEIPAIFVFDITINTHSYINLPTKYYKGLFPEITDSIIPFVKNEPSEENTKPKNKKDLTNVDDILDKLQANKYNTDCLTDKEKNILDNFAK